MNELAKKELEERVDTLGRAREMIHRLQRDNDDLLADAEADAIKLEELARERDAAIAERDTLRASLVRFDHDLSGLRGDLDLARDLCEAVERWTGHGNYPEDSVLVGDIREAAAVLRDALDRRE